MPITIYPGTVKKRNLNGTYSDLVPGADANPQLANDIAEEYDPVAGVYSVGDYCIYQSVLYKCITAISTPEAFNSTKWTDVSVTDEIGGVKNTLNQLDTATQRIIPILPGSTNNLGYTLNIGDYFEAGGVLYKVTTAIPNTEAWANKASVLTVTAVNDLKNTITPQNGIYLGIMTKTVSDNKTLVIIPLSGIDLSKYSISCTLLQVGGDSFTINSTDKYVGGLAFWISGDWTTNYSGKEAKATLYFTRV